MARSFTRRDFLSGSLGVGAAGAAHATLGPVRTRDGSRSATRAATASTRKAVTPGATSATAAAKPKADRTLVLCTLFGGNDGLNTVIPYESSPTGSCAAASPYRRKWCNRWAASTA